MAVFFEAIFFAALVLLPLGYSRRGADILTSCYLVELELGLV